VHVFCVTQQQGDTTQKSKDSLIVAFGLQERFLAVPVSGCVGRFEDKNQCVMIIESKTAWGHWWVEAYGVIDSLKISVSFAVFASMLTDEAGVFAKELCVQRPRAPTGQGF
jgi:hypothetical protein